MSVVLASCFLCRLNRHGHSKTQAANRSEVEQAGGAERSAEEHESISTYPDKQHRPELLSHRDRREATAGGRGAVFALHCCKIGAARPGRRPSLWRRGSSRHGTARHEAQQMGYWVWRLFNFYECCCQLGESGSICKQVGRWPEGGGWAVCCDFFFRKTKRATPS